MMARLASTLVALGALTVGAAACGQAGSLLRRAVRAAQRGAGLRRRPGLGRPGVPGKRLASRRRASTRSWPRACASRRPTATPPCAVLRASRCSSGRASARVGCYEMVEGLYEDRAWTSTRSTSFPGEIDSSCLPSRSSPSTSSRRATPRPSSASGTSGPGKAQGERGFQEYVGLQSNVPRFHAEDLSFQRRGDYPDPSGFTEDFLVDCSLCFIDRAGTRPFFVYLAYSLVHPPLEADEDLLRKYARKPATPFHRNTTLCGHGRDARHERFGELLDGLLARGLRGSTLRGLHVRQRRAHRLRLGWRRLGSRRPDHVQPSAARGQVPAVGRRDPRSAGRRLRRPVARRRGGRHARHAARPGADAPRPDRPPALPRGPRSTWTGSPCSGCWSSEDPPAERALYWHFPGYRGLIPGRAHPRGHGVGLGATPRRCHPARELEGDREPRDRGRSSSTTSQRTSRRARTWPPCIPRWPALWRRSSPPGANASGRPCCAARTE